MVRTQIHLSEDDVELLRAAARETGASRAELIRRAVRAAYGKRARRWPKSIGIAASGTLDATEVEEWLEREWAVDAHDRHP